MSTQPGRRDLHSLISRAVGQTLSEVQQHRHTAVDPYTARLLRKRVDSVGGGRRDSTAHPVGLDVTVLDVWNADVKSESFCAKLKVRARWLCPSEHAEEAMAEGGDGLDTGWEPEWCPYITIGSSMNTQIEYAFYAAERDAAGLVWITGDWTMNSHILEAYDLHAFPFDVQDFNIVVRMENSAMRMELQALPNLTQRGGEHTSRKRRKRGQPTSPITRGGCAVRVEAAGLELPDFRTLRARNDGSNWLECAALYRTLPKTNEVQVVLLYERNPLFYVMNFMLLLFAITSCAAFGWSIAWEQVEDRLALDVTLLLTSIAFKQVLAGTVPPISYLTRLDAYALGSLGFLLLATAAHAALGFLSQHCEQCSFARADAAAMWAWGGAWLAANALYAAAVRRMGARARRTFSLRHAARRGFRRADVSRLDVKEWYDEEEGEGEEEKGEGGKGEGKGEEERADDRAAEKRSSLISGAV
ncbi:hypothetical protein AB1Y20_017129 [Prymnesium parvum]|uniref:Neurotransmitter-gated ion-channel ligand-binding domain-containing protein n=1 Tax=Prymnesium parvum TaxID=97485 RepID=A0AB34IBL7_PRYPA